MNSQIMVSVMGNIITFISFSQSNDFILTIWEKDSEWDKGADTIPKDALDYEQVSCLLSLFQFLQNMDEV